MGGVPAVGESLGGLEWPWEGSRLVLWLWIGAGFRCGGDALCAGGEYDVNGCVANGLKFAPLRGDDVGVGFEVDMVHKRKTVVVVGTDRDALL